MTFHRHALTLLAVLLPGGPALAQQSFEVVPADGRSFAAALTTFSAGTFRFESEDGPRELKAAELVQWGHSVDATRGAQVLTADGSLLVGDVVEIRQDQLLLLSDLFDEVHLPLAHVRGVIFQVPADRRQRDALLLRLREGAEKSDRLILVNGDELSGTLHGLGDDSVDFETRVGRVKIGVVSEAGGEAGGKVAVLALNPALAPAPPADAPGPVMAGFKDGTLVAAASLEHLPTAIRLTLASGATLESSAPQDLVFLQPLGRGIRYLSDLKPHSYQHVPYISLHWPYHNDRSVTGARLRSGGKLYLKGLGMHSTSRLTYRLDGGARRFAAEAALDDTAGRKGSVVFRVFLFQEGQWREAYSSPIVRGGDPPRPILVELADAQALSLIVDFADRGDELDHANWLNPRLLPGG